jgi:hypothetical protein
MLIVRSRIRSIRCCRTDPGRLSQRSICGISRRRRFGRVHRQGGWLLPYPFRCGNAEPELRTALVFAYVLRFRSQSVLITCDSCSTFDSWPCWPPSLPEWAAGSRSGEPLFQPLSWHHYAPKWFCRAQRGLGSKGQDLLAGLCRAIAVRQASHSARSACIVSTRAARAAGTNDAKTADVTTTAADPINGIGPGS